MERSNGGGIVLVIDQAVNGRGREGQKKASQVPPVAFLLTSSESLPEQSLPHEAPLPFDIHRDRSSLCEKRDSLSAQTTEEPSRERTWRMFAFR